MQTHPESLSILDFTYNLPEERIAHFPLSERDASKLLVYKDRKISHITFAQLGDEIPENALLVFNATKVIRARILMQRASGATVEIFCTDAADNSVDFVKLLETKNEVSIRAFIGNGKRWKENEELIQDLKIRELNIRLVAKRIGPAREQSIIKLSWTPTDFSFAEILEAIGKIPLPPYLNREEEMSDAERYQTIYAQHNGSVAAPTAGLHFTTKVLENLKAKKINFAEVTLHVGAGTFKPVKAEKMAGHDMHREQIIIPRSLIEQIIAQKSNPVIAVGTTALRTLESLYWFGKQIITQPGRHFASLFVGQWEPYNNTPDVPVQIALRAILDWMRENNRDEIKGYTQILIAPGYSFKIVNALITNFHQPQSTLLLLVSAFIGEESKLVYEYALKNDFRFLSYGDSSLLWRKE
ncbi:MAG: S-adenosylmethionine:tRNA ribosyltransferase-isomerase [Bacteroidetes bacterium]|jgi:S-adenosylmethionine:tRNA ribosyltransferase-isomerase|nr:S-adenosylmethionine:tRNA ribosyltransferase-isomerase [Bacteroidota bacterium]